MTAAVPVDEFVLKRFTGGHRLVSVGTGPGRRYEVRRRGAVVAVAHSVPELAATLDQLGFRSDGAGEAATVRRVPARARKHGGRTSPFGRERPHRSR